MTRNPQPKGNRRKTSQEHGPDLDLWAAATADVKPLPKRHNKPTSNTLMGVPGDPPPARQKFKPLPTKLDIAQRTDLGHGQAPGLDRRTQQRLRRGKVNIEARIDLHGMTQSAAHDALYNFLERAFMAGKKTVLVVTGKGLRADGRIGVLRQAVPQWLNTVPIRQWVHAFDHAAPRDGGEGALYIVMRRQR